MSGHILVVDRWACGASQAPYDRANVGVHVGDDRTTVALNRAATADLAGVAFSRTVVMNPVHGSDVVVVDDLEAIELTDVGKVAPAADALVTHTPGVALMVMAADCAPVTITGLSTNGVPAVAAVHVGWKGLTSNVLGRTLAHFDPRSVDVHIHPCICGNHYPVPRERAQLVPAEALVRCDDGQVGIDLRAGLRAQCESAGVAQVSADPRCTFESNDFYSYRRDSTTGRFAVLVWM